MGVAPVNFQVERLSRSKMVRSVSLSVIKEIEQIISAITGKENIRFTEAERIIMQMVALAKSKGLLDDFPPPPITTDILKFYWGRLYSDNDLKPGTVSVEGLTGPFDNLIIFNRVLAEWR
jgi:hypothetical protein